MSNIPDNIDVKKIEISIRLLNEYVKDSSIEPLLSVLEAIKNDPDNKLLLTEFSDTWRSLGITQGAVLTYAPYISTLISDDLFGDK